MGLNVFAYSGQKDQSIYEKSSLMLATGFFLETHVEVPIKYSNHSVRSGFNLSKYTYSASFSSGAEDYDLLVNQVKYEIPLLCLGQSQNYIPWK